MQPPVWISILFIFIGTLVFVQIFEAQAVQVSACYGSGNCNYFSLNCSVGGRIQVNSLQYGTYGSRHSQCQNTNCLEETSCCTYDPGDCLKDFPVEDKKSILDKCSGNSSCGPIRVLRISFTEGPNCSGPASQYAVKYYTCVHGQSTTRMSTLLSSNTTVTSLTSKPSSSAFSLTSTDISIGRDSASTPSSDAAKGKYEGGNSVPTIIGVVVAVIIVIAVVTVALIIFKRRQKMRKEHDTHISSLPSGSKNHTYESSKEAGTSNAVVEISNYDSINDESVLTYSRPVKKTKDTTGIPESAKKYGDVSADEYDSTEFEKKGAIKEFNYDSSPAVEGKIGDNAYSHVSNQSKSVTTARATANEYSHCKLNSKDTLRNDDDYSHVDLDRDWKKNQHPNTSEEDSYNHIDFDDTKHPMKNGKAVIGENEYESEKNSPTYTNVKSREMESEKYPLNKEDTGVSSKDAQDQGIKAVSLRDSNKDQQYTAFVKVKKEKQSNGVDGGAKENLESRRPNILLNTLSNSDYELAKPIDL